MKLPELDKEDIIHIVDLLREDLLTCRKLLDEHPLDEEVMDSFLRSRKLLQRIASDAIVITYEPTTMATRPHLN